MAIAFAGVIVAGFWLLALESKVQSLKSKVGSRTCLGDAMVFFDHDHDHDNSANSRQAIFMDSDNDDELRDCIQSALSKNYGFRRTLPMKVCAMK